MNATPKYWFPAKSYGWGWGLPSSWQGWVVYGAFAASVFVLGATLAGICFAKGEPPRWHWGSR